ncbi:MAG TPA: DUF6141 family protein [Bacteroidales bacterium]|nr:DUF6141 family protein [Bacteroidales bacterium]HRW97084.1 DUF6141 family protein [Bacteroidales bacterium]
MAKIQFTEKQKFNQIWLWIILIIPLLLVVWGFVQQVIIGKPFGNKPTPDWMYLLLLLILGGILALFGFTKLETLIDTEGIHYRFTPFYRTFRKISWDETNRVYVRKYSPILEYGGWGVRYGIKGKALNVSGNKGLQIEFTNGKKLLIGTQQPEELQKVLNQLVPAKLSGQRY